MRCLKQRLIEVGIQIRDPFEYIFKLRAFQIQSPQRNIRQIFLNMSKGTGIKISDNWGFSIQLTHLVTKIYVFGPNRPVQPLAGNVQLCATNLRGIRPNPLFSSQTLSISLQDDMRLSVSLRCFQQLYMNLFYESKLCNTSFFIFCCYILMHNI